MGRPVKNLKGKTFGYWQVLEFAGTRGNHTDAYWKCRCKLCDRIFEVRSDRLQSGHSTKCKHCAAIERCYG